MASHKSTFQSFALTEFFGYDRDYWEQLHKLSGSDRALIEDQIEVIHAATLLCISAAMDHQLLDFSKRNPHLSDLARLLSGDISAIVIGGDRVEIELTRQSQSIVVVGFAFRTVH